MKNDTNGLTKISHRKHRWRKFLAGDPAVKHMFLLHPPEGLAERPLPYPENIIARIEWAWQRYRVQMERLDWLEDDAIPFLDPYTGTEIFAEAFGCPVYFPENDMPHARPIIFKATEVSRLKVPELDVPALARVFQIADALQARAGAAAVMRLVDIQSPMDIAALIWNKTDFFLALIDAPDAVIELAAKCRELLCNFLDVWFARYGRNYIAHYPEYYLEQGMTLSEDEVGAVSPTMFEQFFLPELRYLSQRYHGIGIHCCADCRHLWSQFKKIPQVFLWNLPHERSQEAYHYFADTPAQIHQFLQREVEIVTLLQRFPTARIIFDVSLDSRAAALELLSHFESLR
jgi:hypothetical protein